MHTSAYMLRVDIIGELDTKDPNLYLGVANVRAYGYVFEVTGELGTLQ
jgi:hypothetical protein